MLPFEQAMQRRGAGFAVVAVSPEPALDHRRRARDGG